LASSAETPPLEMHPDDARTRGLRDGATVRVWNDLGEVHLPLKVTDRVRPGVVSSLKGAWCSTSDNGQTVSALAPGHHADIAGGPCYNDTRGEVASLGAGDTRQAAPARRRTDPRERDGSPMLERNGAEEARLTETRERNAPWKKWGPYLSERQWGTVREDYSQTGNAWDYLTHDQARSRAYRWGEDGLA